MAMLGGALALAWKVQYLPILFTLVEGKLHQRDS